MLLLFKDASSLPDMRITKDTDKDKTISVVCEDGKVFKFKPHRNGLEPLLLIINLNILLTLTL